MQQITLLGVLPIMTKSDGSDFQMWYESKEYIWRDL